MPTTRSRSAALAAMQVNGVRRLRSSTRAQKPLRPLAKPRAQRTKGAKSRQIRPVATIGGVLTVAGPSDEQEISEAIEIQTSTRDPRTPPPPSFPRNPFDEYLGEDIPMSGTAANPFFLQPDSPLTRVDRPGKNIRYQDPDPEVTAALDKLLVDVEEILGRLPPGASYSVHLTRRSSRDPHGTVIAAASRSYRASASAFTSSFQQAPVPTPGNVLEEPSRTAQMVSDARREFLGMQLNSIVPDTEGLLHMPEDGLPVGYQTTAQTSPAAGVASHVMAAGIDTVTVSPGTVSGDGTILGDNMVAIVTPDNRRRSVQESRQNVIPAYETFRAWRRADSDDARERHSEGLRIPGRRQPAPATPPLHRIVTPRTILGLEELFGDGSDIPEAESPLSDKILWAKSSMNSGSSAMPSAGIRAQRQVVDVPARVPIAKGPGDHDLGAYGSGGVYVEEPTIRDTEAVGGYVTQVAGSYVEESTIPDTPDNEVYVEESTVPDTPDNGLYVEESTAPDTPIGGVYVSESTIPDTPDTVRLTLTD